MLFFSVVIGCGSVDPDSRSTDPPVTDPPDGPGPSGSGAFVGTTEEGADVVVAVNDRGEVLVSWSSARCGEGDAEVENRIDPFDAEGTIVDGRIRAAAKIIEPGYDGDETEYYVEVDGEDLGDGGLSGVLRVEERYVNGQGEDLEDGYEPSVCEPVDERWTAELSDDPQLAAGLWAFRQAALDDVDAITAAIAAGLDPGVRHPIRDSTLTQNVSSACVEHFNEGEFGFEVTQAGEEVPFPSPEAERTEAALVELGVPPAGCTGD